MGLTSDSTGFKALDTEIFIKKKNPSERLVAIAGNPNVGKSTVFNALTGMHQHTGNWAGKTVTNTKGFCKTENFSYILVDIPGTYSLLSHSPEEEIARNFICFGEIDAVIIVCDATCLERNLNLVLQTLEITHNVVLCVNLMDEAKRKGIKIDLEKLSQELGIQVVGTVARNKKSVENILKATDSLLIDNSKRSEISIQYPDTLENAINIISSCLDSKTLNLNKRWLSVRLLENDYCFTKEIKRFLGEDFFDNKLLSAITEAQNYLYINNITREKLKDIIVSSIVAKSEIISDKTVSKSDNRYNHSDQKFDRILTGRAIGYPVMLLLLALVFWLTVSGANYISEALSSFFGFIELKLSQLLINIGTPKMLKLFLIEGVWRVPTWVISVMLPPMAIFFPLFTLLEDAGYLPRIAYNLDKPFKRCGSCGKQALTMCMGFGCNAAGIVGCRIIDSNRERILAILTNSFVPCNGRFPALISIITIFFVATSGLFSSITTALLLSTVILLGVFMTFVATKLLSSTILKGVPSSYILELPPYRKPKIVSVIIRSVFDRTLFVLARSIAVAIPAGIIIWLMANISIDGQTLLKISSDFIDPFARLLGLDGVILIAFILGFPANEIVIPLVLMAYLSSNSLTEISSLAEMRNILISNGWTVTTALCTMVFSLMHWPCSTTVLTIKKETNSIKWTLLSVLLPTLCGMLLCFSINFISKIFV